MKTSQIKLPVLSNQIEISKADFTNLLMNDYENPVVEKDFNLNVSCDKVTYKVLFEIIDSTNPVWVAAQRISANGTTFIKNGEHNV